MAIVAGADALNAILICGMMGVVGQGARAAVGLKSSAGSSSATPTAQSSFSAAYFALSLMIGFIAGVLAGFVTGLANFVTLDLSNTKLYAGADFIENSLSIVIPPNPQSIASKGQSTPPQAADTQAKYTPEETAIVRVATPTFPISPVSLSAALSATSPTLTIAIWTPALIAAFTKFDVNTSRRAAAAVGQFLVEAGSSFQELAERLNYTANQLMQYFPHEFPDIATAQHYAGQSQRIANRAYANRLGNGDEASGDGYLFRGRGLIQITGRDEYTQFGGMLNKTAAEAASYCETTEGAAMSGCWYLSTRGCLPFADTWNIPVITRRVNGSAMVGGELREKYSQDMLKHLGGSA
jgi:predicted chitinase